MLFNTKHVGDVFIKKPFWFEGAFNALRLLHMENSRCDQVGVLK